ncbi:hypothetical protein [Leifsonia sp. C5G2]|uniref:hypothetical protein n=1 Tax=Leifsonia sp. C5G2 TaxID=2735269 RepID=UPI00158527DB|nr:hypothetical protein [Leifsonia sp. C5G2]NUU08426.1 hypothetical protein [Leifsonia sp. C5G2]
MVQLLDGDHDGAHDGQLLDGGRGVGYDGLDVDRVGFDAVRLRRLALDAHRFGDRLESPADAASSFVDGEPVRGRDGAGGIEELHDAFRPHAERPRLAAVLDSEAHRPVQADGDRHASGDHAGAQLLDARGLAGPLSAVDRDAADVGRPPVSELVAGTVDAGDDFGPVRDGF